MPQVIDCGNSFVTFTDTTFLTDRSCGIVKPFCYPIYESADLKFQVQYSILGIVGDIDFAQTKITLTNADGVGTIQLSDVIVYDEFLGGGLLQLLFDFSAADIADWQDGECYHFKIELYVTPEEGAPYYQLLGVSNQCFQRIGDVCFTSRLDYSNNEAAFGFIFPTSDWTNRIRLPITFRNPQPKNDQKVYVRSNGTRKKLYARLSKQFEGVTDQMTEEAHQKLVVALSHDNITFVTDNDYSLECTFEDEYNQDFPKEMQGINIWGANFNVMETPFDEVNNNCA